MIRIVAVDNSTLILDALEEAINRYKDLQLVATSIDRSGLIDLVEQHQPQVAILGMGLRPDTFNPVICFRNLKEHFPKVKVLVLTFYDDDVWARALVKAGVEGYKLKSDISSECFDSTIHLVNRGGLIIADKISDRVFGSQKTKPKFTEQEESILRLICIKGQTIEMAAIHLGIPLQRVRDLLQRIIAMGSDDESIEKARTLGLLPGEDLHPNLDEMGS